MNVFDSSGPKRAFIFSVGVEPKDCIEEANCMRTQLENLGLDFLDEADELDYCLGLKPDEFLKKLKEINTTCERASCIFIYIMLSQDGEHFMDGIGNKLKLNQILTVFTEESDALIQIPKLIFVQANIKHMDLTSVNLMNKVGDDEEECDLPASCNMLVFYYPKYGNGQLPLSSFLFDEIGRKNDVISNLTLVLSKIMEEKINGARFSSTLTKKLYLRQRDDNELQSLEHYSSLQGNGKRLAYAFIFEKFLNKDLKEDKTMDLSGLAKLDRPQIQHAFKQVLGFELEFCIQNGKMEVNEFKEKLNNIVRSIEERNDDVESLAFILSSHGDAGGTLCAYDGCFNVDDIWMPLANCKTLRDKPKLIFLDACRGSKMEKVVKKPRKDKLSQTTSKTQDKSTESLLQEPTQANEDRPEFCDILHAMSSTEGKVSHFNERGSHFIQDLCSVLCDFGKQHDVLTLLTEVINIASKNNTRDGKQQVTFTTSLRKQYFFHGQPPGPTTS